MLDKLTDFVLEHTDYFDREKIKEVLQKHIEYNTIACPIDKDGEIMGLAIWNIKDETAYITEVIVNPKYRGKNFIKYLIALGWEKWKWVKYICFKRERKYGNRVRLYKIKDFFKKE